MSRLAAVQSVLGEGTQYGYPWHPDPASPANKPHEIATVTTRNGTRKRIVVSAPGHVDSVTICEGDK